MTRTTIMTFETMLTEKEKLLRKEWLIFNIIGYFIMPIINIVFGYGNQISTGTPEKFSTALAGGLFVLFFSFIYFLLNYQCAYKKPGTKLLTLSLALFILGLLGSFITLFKISSTLEVCIFIIQFAFSTWWAILTFKMRKLNHQIKLRGSILNLP